MTEHLNVQRLELNKYCHSSGLQPSSRRGGKAKNAQGRRWGVSSVCLPVCPEDLFGPQVESKLKLSKAGAATEKEMRQEMFSWSVGEDGWKEGGIKKWPAWESTAEKSSVLIIVKNSPSISRVLLY